MALKEFGFERFCCDFKLSRMSNQNGGGGNHIPFADLKQNLKHITFYITNFMRADFTEWISFSYLIEESD